MREEEASRMQDDRARMNEPLTKELLCVLSEIGFDKARLQKNPHGM